MKAGEVFDDVRAEMQLDSLTPSARLSSWRIESAESESSADKTQRIIDMPIYRGEATLRHANALQLTADNPAPSARLHTETLEALSLTDAETVVAVWGLESSYGENLGDINIIEALATLAYDGRRAKFGRSQLLEALKIIQRGDITPNRMNGSWAGAMGKRR